MEYRLEILGPPRVLSLDTGEEVPLSLGKPLALLAYLAVENRPMGRDHLADLFWPESPPPRARQSLRQALWLLRRTFGEDVFEGDDPVAVCGALTTDLGELHEALRRGEADTARRLWRGPLLSRLALSGCRKWDQWLEDRRESLRSHYSRSLVEAARVLRDAGRLEETRLFLEEAVRLNPSLLPGRVALVETLLDLRLTAAARTALDEIEMELGDFPGAEENVSRLRRYLEGLDSDPDDRDLGQIGPSLEFVGRSMELDDLRGLWRRAERGVPAVALIRGPAGVGKTRLAAEFAGEVRSKGGRTVRVSGYADEQAIPLGIVADLAAELMTLPGAAGVSASTQNVVASLAPGSAAGRNGVEATGDRNLATIAHAVTDLVEAVGFEAPTLILVDDLQWLDPESYSILLKVMRRVRGVPCLFALSRRTEILGGPDRLPARESENGIEGMEIELRPFTEEEVRELLTLFAEFTDPVRITDVVQRIFRVSGGNPLFISELLRTLAEEGHCRLVEDRWVIDSEAIPEELALPGSLQTLLRARVGRLSPESAAVASVLAESDRTLMPGVLRRRAGLEESPFSQAVAELTHREIVLWQSDGTLGFTHDQLRQAVRLATPALPTSGTLETRRSFGRVGTTAAFLLLAMVLTTGFFASRALSVPDDPPTFPFGQGRILVVADPLFELIPPQRAGGEWTRRPTALSAPPAGPLWGRLKGPFPTTDGTYRWFGSRMEGEDPPFVEEFFVDGPSRLVYRQAGDVGFQDLSPDGTTVLLTEERLERDLYSHRLLALNRGTRAADTLLEGDDMLIPATWSPDGQRIATGKRGPSDTLLVITPGGEELFRRVFAEYEEEARPISWCPDSRHLALTVYGGSGSTGLLLDAQTGEENAFGAGYFSVRSPVCLGDGSGVLYLGEKEDRTEIVMEHLSDPTHEVLASGPQGTFRVLTWIPDGVEPPVVGLAVRGRASPLEWGTSRRLEAEAIRTDGSQEPATPEWISREPNVASVTSSGVLTGNRVGSTYLVAEYNEWLRDSVRVVVVEGDREQEDLLFRETFESGSLDNWIVDEAYPEPTVVRRDASFVMMHNGDGRYSDPVFSRSDFPLSRGATLELEVKLTLTDRTDRQRFRVCMQEPGDASEDLETLTSGTHWETCFEYPRGELSRRRRDRALYQGGSPRIIEVIPLGSPLSPDEWHHLAIQVRADGNASVFLDRELLHTASVYASPSEDDRWRIVLMGAAVDTELLFRNITVWRGLRMDGEAF